MAELCAGIKRCNLEEKNDDKKKNIFGIIEEDEEDKNNNMNHVGCGRVQPKFVREGLNLKMEWPDTSDLEEGEEKKSIADTTKVYFFNTQNLYKKNKKLLNTHFIKLL